MPWYLGAQLGGSGCTTVLIPGWAAVAVVFIAAAPRLAREVLMSRSGS